MGFFLKHEDKGWEMTDCIAFAVIHEQVMKIAATADRHYMQAGFRSLLLEM